ncbi:hypothetical protein TUM12151_35130 [Morganella morganii]|nr:hypothetical protein TUM12149_33780 [Morganella morganii]GIZ30711.1 hypothetical protein TUM12150_11970 [Morganella morganii]GIZ36527.1 hypothetical protein TUM12151_35130 [Morganella morganii]
MKNILQVKDSINNAKVKKLLDSLRSIRYAIIEIIEAREYKKIRYTMDSSINNHVILLFFITPLFSINKTIKDNIDSEVKFVSKYRMLLFFISYINSIFLYPKNKSFENLL